MLSTTTRISDSPRAEQAIALSATGFSDAEIGRAAAPNFIQALVDAGEIDSRSVRQRTLRMTATFDIPRGRWSIRRQFYFTDAAASGPRSQEIDTGII